MAEKQIHWDSEVDLICVGSGLGGLTAAIVAHDAGKKVVVFEKAAKAGGVCAYSGGEVFVPCNHKMQAQANPDTDEAAHAYLSFLGGGFQDPDLLKGLLRNAPVAARYLEERANVRWKTIAGFPDYYHPHAPGTAAQGRYLEVEPFSGAQLGAWQHKTIAASPHLPPGITHDELFAWGGLTGILTWDFRTMGKRLRDDVRCCGPGMMAYFVKATAVDRSIPIHVESAVRELITVDGRVVGVRVHQQGRDVMVRAHKGVVLAIGGYDWNPELARYHERFPEWHSMCPPVVQGENIIMGGEIGAAIAAVPSDNLGMFFGYSIPGEEHFGKPLYRASWEGGYPHALWVNRRGQRFCDEAFYKDYLPRTKIWDGRRQEHVNYPPYLIFDQNFRDKYALATYLPGQELPETFVVRGDTPAELAHKLGVDAEGLSATIQRFNQYANSGVDPDFDRGQYPWAAMMTGDRSRPNPNLGPLDKPPYYGLKLVPVGAGINAAGLLTDDCARVQHVRGHAIPGLYAVGNSAAPLDTGAGYQSGLSNVRGMVWGFVAGRHAAGM